MQRLMRGRRIIILLLVFLVLVFGRQRALGAPNGVGNQESDRNPSGETGSYILDSCIVDVRILRSDNGDTLIFTLENEGDLDVSHWSIVFEANYTILSTNDVSIIENGTVKYIDCLENNAYIGCGESVSFALNIVCEDEYSVNTNYRVYGCYDTNTSNVSVEGVRNVECIDVLSYHAATGEYELDINETKEIDQMQPDGVESEFWVNEQPLFETQAGIYSVIGNSDSRVKVSSVKSRPYSSIVYLYVIFPDGAIGQATGFVVGDHHLITAAHAVYGASVVVAYFGANERDYEHISFATDWYVCSAYVTNANSVSNDWAVVEFGDDIADITGRLLIGYTTYDYQLSMMNYTVCGYPTDKFIVDSNGINGKQVYMYKDSSDIYGYSSDVLYYLIDTEAGQSGSPIYNSETYTVYGIHCKGTNDNSYNAGRRITRDLYTMFLNNGWLNYT